MRILSIRAKECWGVDEKGQSYEYPEITISPEGGIEAWRFHTTYEKGGKTFDLQLDLCKPGFMNICDFKEIEKK